MGNIKIDSLGAEIAKLMEEYADTVSLDMKSVVKTVSRNAVKELKTDSPKGKGSKKGHYKDGWTSKTESENATAISVRIYNKTKPGLTHLLEKGHAKRGGGRVNGIPHIAPIEEKVIEEYEKKLKEGLTR